MNYLQLVQRLRLECGIPGSGPTTVIGNTGEMSRLCTWINQAWTELQEYRPDWDWMRKDVSFNTIAGKNKYSPTTDILLSDFGQWKMDSFRIYPTSAGISSQILLQPYEYNGFRDSYLLATRQTTLARPIAISEAPDKSLVLGLVPDQEYTVTGEYFVTPVELVLDTDTPLIPIRFHMAIVYKAMMKYGMYEAAAEVFQSSENLLSSMLNRLEQNQTPMITIGHSLI